MDHYNFINNTDPEVIDDLYRQFKENPENVEKGWRSFFQGFDFAV